jgi:hypothetical protein
VPGPGEENAIKSPPHMPQQCTVLDKPSTKASQIKETSIVQEYPLTQPAAAV